MIYHAAQGDEYTWFKIDGQQLHFNHMGKLERITAPTRQIGDEKSGEIIITRPIRSEHRLKLPRPAVERK